MSSADPEASIAERLGGPWAISWQGFAITAPLAVLILLVGSRTPVDALTWGLIGLMAVAVGGAGTYVMHRTLFRDRGRYPVPLHRVVIWSLTASALYVGTAVALGLWWGVIAPASIPVQFIPLYAVTVAWGLLLALVLDSQWRFRVQREALVQQAVQQQLAGVQGLEFLRDVRESVRREVHAHILESSQPLIERIDQMVASGEADVGELADELRVSAESTVRPLSHELERRARQSHRLPGLGTALGNIIRHQPFRPLAVSVIYAITTTPREVSDFGVAVGLGALVVTVTFIFVIMSALNSAMARWPDAHARIFIGGLVLLQLPTIMLSPLRTLLTGERVTAADLMVSIFFGTFIVLATSAFGSWNRTRRQMLADFRREVDIDTISTMARSYVLSEATMDAALVLHGTVQSQLHACALSIENAARKGDLVEVNRSLVHARALLEHPELGALATEKMGLVEAVNAQVEQWRGLLDVAVEIDPQCDVVQGLDVPHVAHVIEEAIANAFHHGTARLVRIGVDVRESTLVVTVMDDGAGPTRGPAGLGSRLFEKFDACWSLKGAPAGQGAVLSIEMPMVREFSP